MIQTIVIALPALAALIVCLLQGPKQALLNVYLPALLLLPHSFVWPISGQLPFSDPAIFVITLFFLFQPQGEWRWSIIDFLVVAYVVITVVSCGINSGYKLGQNQALKEFCSLLLPYYIAKQTMGREQFAIEVGKRIVAILVIVAILSVYEFRMGRDLFLWPFSGIFPSPGTEFRAGLMRIQGPFGHPMTAGFMMAVGYPVAAWLSWKGIWREKLVVGLGRTASVGLPISKINFCKLWILAGLAMTISYGDWIGAVGGMLLLLICRARNRKLALGLVILCAIVIGPPVASSFRAYMSVDPATVIDSDKTQADVAYRNILLQIYIPVVKERPSWGWGEFPVLRGMYSIDNGYLWTALVYGLYALALWVAILLVTATHLCALGLRLPRAHPAASTAFTLTAIYVIFAFCNTEGALMSGAQIVRCLFLFTGWSVALLKSNIDDAVKVRDSAALPPRRFAFRRVMA